MADAFKEIERAEAGGKPSDDPTVEFFRKEIAAAKKRERAWRKDAARIIDIYEAKRADENSFNILYSNTETLLPVLYSGTPRPVVERTFRDPDPLAKAAAEVLERTLKFLVRQGAPYPKFSSLISKAVLGALLPGRGMSQFRYDASLENKPSTVGDATKDAEAAQGEIDLGDDEFEDDDDFKESRKLEKGEDVLQTPGEVTQVTYETVCGESWPYDRVLMGYAQDWTKVPWVAFEYSMTQQDLVENFGQAMAAKIPVHDPARKTSDGMAEREDENDNMGTVKVACVYCIWWKEKRKVLFYAPGYPDEMAKIKDDPLGLDGFYNFPAPLTLMVKYRPSVPTPLYKLYEQQAKELNRLSKRINRLCEALKVRGFYDGSLQGLSELLKADDNMLIAAKNVAMLGEKPNLNNFIFLIDLAPIIQALKECIMAREACKATIYEIMGVADIMRASSVASETATAQNLKNKWGTLRISKGQGRVQSYIRDSLQIMAEIAGKHFSVETFRAMTNLDFAMQAEVEQAQQTLQQIQQMLQQQQEMAQQMGAPGLPGGSMPGQPPQQPQQPQIPPEMQQAMKQAQDILKKPVWENVVALLRNDLLRKYRIDVETDSTIAQEVQSTQEEINEAMAALAQMYQAFLPAVQAGALSMPALKQLILSVARRLPYGKQIEDAVMAMPEQLPPQQDPKAPSKAEVQAKEQEAQFNMQATQQKGAALQRTEAYETQKHQSSLRKAQREEELAMKSHQLKLAEMDLKIQELQLDKVIAGVQADTTVQQAQMSTETAKVTAQAAQQKARQKPAARP